MDLKNINNFLFQFPCIGFSFLIFYLEMELIQVGYLAKYG